MPQHIDATSDGNAHEPQTDLNNDKLKNPEENNHTLEKSQESTDKSSTMDRRHKQYVYMQRKAYILVLPEIK